jgi:hypothetical protein
MEVVATSLVVFVAHMSIVFVVKVEILVLVNGHIGSLKHVDLEV